MRLLILIFLVWLLATWISNAGRTGQPQSRLNTRPPPT